MSIYFVKSLKSDYYYIARNAEHVSFLFQYDDAKVIEFKNYEQYYPYIIEYFSKYHIENNWYDINSNDIEHLVKVIEYAVDTKYLKDVSLSDIDDEKLRNNVIPSNSTCYIS